MLGTKKSAEVSRVPFFILQYRLQIKTLSMLRVCFTSYLHKNFINQATELYSTHLSLREALKFMSTLLHAAGHLLITSASVIRRVIQGADLLQGQQAQPVEYWE